MAVVNAYDTRYDVVCMSDTHGKHTALLNEGKIPDGHILIFAGDFVTKELSKDFEGTTAALNEFFAALPHKYKFFVRGKHERSFKGKTRAEIQAALPNCIYLQDSSYLIDDRLLIYGSPWINRTKNDPDFEALWSHIPPTTDILITHQPPFGRHDLAWEPGVPAEPCATCNGTVHPDYNHWGEPTLREVVVANRIPYHVFGRVHDDNGVFRTKYNTFINASLDLDSTIHTFSMTKYIPDNPKVSYEAPFDSLEDLVHVSELQADGNAGGDTDSNSGSSSSSSSSSSSVASESESGSGSGAGPAAPPPMPPPPTQHKSKIKLKAKGGSGSITASMDEYNNKKLAADADFNARIVYAHGADETSGTKEFKIVHVSDTHGQHHDYVRRGLIPDGDVLIHSGDLVARAVEKDFDKSVADINRFFNSLPHAYKIYVAGNHERCFNGYDREEIEAALDSCIYLQDKAVVIEDCLKIYGSPWNTSGRMGFSMKRKEFPAIWARVPADTDILVTHQPPYNVLDLAWVNGAPNTRCETCGEKHSNFTHWGELALLQRIKELGTPLHCFGHVHDAHGYYITPNTLFTNAAMDLKPRPIGITVRANPAVQKFADADPVVLEGVEGAEAAAANAKGKGCVVS